MTDDPLADLKKLMQQSGFYMKLTTAVVNHVNDRDPANDLLFKNMTDDENEQAAVIFRSLALHAELRSNQRIIKKTPDEWQRDNMLSRIVTQPFGWTHPAGDYEPQAWSVPVTRKEFLDRADMSSSMSKDHGSMGFAYTEVGK